MTLSRLAYGRTRIVRVTLACSVLSATLLAASGSARAQGGETSAEQREKKKGAGVALGADIDGAAIVSQPRPLSGTSLAGGTGFKARLGGQLHVPFIRVTPELGYGYMHVFTTNDVGSAYDWNTHRVYGGVRLGVGEIVVPTVYSHLGYGWRVTNDPTVPSANGLAFDAGIALDFRIIPHLGFGAHAEYAMIDSTPFVPQWLGFGLHADLVF
jgi:hypothetical protein